MCKFGSIFAILIKNSSDLNRLGPTVYIYAYILAIGTNNVLQFVIVQYSVITQRFYEFHVDYQHFLLRKIWLVLVWIMFILTTLGDKLHVNQQYYNQTCCHGSDHMMVWLCIHLWRRRDHTLVGDGFTYTLGGVKAVIVWLLWIYICQ